MRTRWFSYPNNGSLNLINLNFKWNINVLINYLIQILGITADNSANNNTFLKELGYICEEEKIDFHFKENHVRCLAHIMNLTTQEILKHVKAGEACEENIILEEISKKSGDVNVILRLRKLIVKIQIDKENLNINVIYILLLVIHLVLYWM